MSALSRLAGLGAGAAAAIEVDDVFSTYLYTGNGGTQNIVNGIDLSTNGGLVWLKPRSGTYGGNAHRLFDTTRGTGTYLSSNNTDESVSSGNNVTAFNSNGFSLDSTAYNASGEPTGGYASWTFRKAPKFFDIVSYTGTGVNRTISHSLEQEVGTILIKRTDISGNNWQVYHRSLANTEYLVLNSTAAKATGTTRWNSTTATTSVFSLGNNTDVNESGGTYIAYLFAHNAAADGMIQCGSFTSTTGALSISLGWEPQFVLCKRSSGVDNWNMVDMARGFQVDRSTDTKGIAANLSNAESALGLFGPTANGFTHTNGTAGDIYVYIAIRRPTKAPIAGTQIYNAVARTGTGTTAVISSVGFPPDMVLSTSRSFSGADRVITDRLRRKMSRTNATGSEISESGVFSEFNQNGITVSGPDDIYIAANLSGATFTTHFFKRATGVFDIVAYNANATTPRTVEHSLGTVPELVLIKARNASQSWFVYTASSGVLTGTLRLETNSFGYTDTMMNSTPTSSTLSVTGTNVNTNGNNYIAYLFATKAGISKVGTYTGNGTSQTIDCGFSTGARFILIKSTNATGDWFVWDSIRGIIAGNDPYISLNNTGAETSNNDSIDPDSTGFIVNQIASSSINVNTTTYIYLALA